MRLGIFGGSFNPVHLGHALVAQSALEELELDRLIFVPAAQSPFKPDQELAPPAERLRWLRLALAGMTRCAVDEEEIRRGGVSYSIETVRAQLARHPDAAVFWLIGEDHVAQLPRWREADALARLVTFAIIPRPDQAAARAPEPFRLVRLRGFPWAVSSSQVRARVRAGLPIDRLVGVAVAEAIRNSKLYL